VAPCVQSLRTDEQSLDPMAPHILMFEQVLQRADDLDIVHFHTDYVQFPMMRRHSVPHVTTLHGRLDIPELAPLYREFDDEPVVSISNSHRGPLPWAHWQATIYHGIPEDLYAPRPTSGSYLAFLGRISPEKGADAAIAIARQVGMPLKIAAKIGEPDRRYFEAAIKPLLRDPLVEFLGEIDDGEKQRLLGEAAALLFPIDWPEPFGLVLIEAMACGTPVIAFRRGSVPEVIDDGITGFVVDDVAGAVRAFERVATFDRVRCRRVFEERFSARRMAEDHLVLYQKLIEAK